MNQKKVVANSLIYTFNNILLKAFSFLLLPLYTSFLTPSDYGVINLLNSFSSVATYLIAFSLYSAVVRFYADLKNDHEKVRTFFGTILSFVFLSGTLFVLLVLVLQNVIGHYLFQGISFYPSIVLGLLGLVFTSVYTIYQDILKGMQQAKKSATVSISYFLLQVVLNILFVVVFSMGADGVLLSQLIASLLACTWMLFDLRKNHLVRFCIDRALLKDALHYSIPIIPHNLSTHIAQFVSRVFINETSSLTSVGLFGLASKFGHLSDIIQSSVNMAFQPWFFDHMKKREHTDTVQIVSLSKVLLWFYSLFFLGLSLFSQEMIHFMATDGYQSSWMLVPGIVATYAFKTPYYFYINILFFYKKASRYIFTATVSSSLINVILSYFLIRSYGMYGSVAADAIAMIIRVAIIVYIANKFDAIGYSFWTFLRMIGLTFIFMIVGLYFSYSTFSTELSLVNFLYKCTVLLVFMIIAYFMNRKKFDLALNFLKRKKK